MRFLHVSLCLVLLASAALYWLQHTGVLSGGAIAPSKLGWLFTAIIFWYILPVFWLMDKGISGRAKILLSLFLGSMVLRACVELFMMYVSNDWLHAYGIAHDIFSLGVCVTFAFNLRESGYLVVYFFYNAGLFALEAYFAHYLQSVSGGNGSVFFLEPSPEHQTVLWLTRIAVVVSIAMFTLLIKRKTSATLNSRNSNA